MAASMTEGYIAAGGGAAQPVSRPPRKPLRLQVSPNDRAGALAGGGPEDESHLSRDAAISHKAMSS